MWWHSPLSLSISESIKYFYLYHHLPFLECSSTPPPLILSRSRDVTQSFALLLSFGTDLFANQSEISIDYLPTCAKNVLQSPPTCLPGKFIDCLQAFSCDSISLQRDLHSLPPLLVQALQRVLWFKESDSFQSSINLSLMRQFSLALYRYGVLFLSHVLSLPMVCS